MNVLDLYATITMDTSEYDRGLEQAVGKAASFTSNVGKGLKNFAKITGAAIGAASAVIGKFAQSAIDAGAQFDATMAEVSAISGATGADFDALRQKAMEMGASTKFSATESAEALTYMAMAGWKTEDMLSGLEGIMNLAAASGENLATTSDIVTDALTAFGMSAEESGRFADVLAAASSNANTNVGMLGESFKYVAPVAGALGYSAEDTAVALGLMANSGIKASQAGTALRAALSSMLEPSGPVESAMERLGLRIDGTTVAMENSDGTTKSLAETLGILRESFAKLTEAEQAEYAANIFGREAMSGMLAIINASEADYRKLTTAIYDADGAAQKMAATMVDNLAGDITLFKSALEGAKIVLSDQLTPAIRNFVQFGSEAVSTLSAAFQSGGLDKLMDALEGVLSKALGKIISILPDVIDAGTQLLGALGRGLLDNLPVLIDAAKTIVLQLADGLTQSLPTLIPAIVGVIEQIVDTLTEPTTLSALIDGALAIILALADGLIAALPKLIEAIPAIIINLVDAVAENAPKLLEAGAMLLFALVEGLIIAVPELISKIPEIVMSIVEGFKEMWPEIKEIGRDFVTRIWEGIQSAAVWIGDKVGGFFEEIRDRTEEFLLSLPERVAFWLGETLAELINWGHDAIEWVKTETPKLIEEFFRWFAQLPVRIGEFLAEALAKFAKWGVDIISSLNTLPARMAEAGRNMIDGLFSGIKNAWASLEEKFGRLVDSFLAGFRNKLDIHSPSGVFADIGKNMALGLGQGWGKEFSHIQSDINGALDFGSASLALSASAGGAASGGSFGGTTFSGLTININGANYSDENALAEAIALRLQRMTERRGAAYA